MLATLFKTVSGLNAAEMQGLCYRRLHDKAAWNRCCQSQVILDAFASCGRITGHPEVSPKRQFPGWRPSNDMSTLYLAALSDTSRDPPEISRLFRQGSG